MKLSSKIVLLVLTLSIFFGLGSAAVINLYLQDRLSDEIQRWTTSLSQALSESITRDVINDNVIDTRDTLWNLVHKNDALLCIFITDFDGSLFTHTFDAGFPRALITFSKNTGNQHGFTEYSFSDTNVLHFSEPLIDGMQAKLHICVDKSKITDILNKSSRDIFTVSIIIALIGIAIAIPIGLRISRPLQNLSKIVTAYGKGDRGDDLNLKYADNDGGDPTLVQLLLTNILGNAWKYTSGQAIAEITFSARHENGKQVFFVCDNGIGFDIQYSDKLYKPFHRLHGQEQFPGSGVGLAIAERIVQRHGGEIWAESEINKGATFYFTLT